jgi:CheY-like chemotaxis protein
VPAQQRDDQHGEGRDRGEHTRRGREEQNELGMKKSARQVSVLIVDDSEDGRDLYGEYLTFKGFRVLTAANGSQAIAAAQEHRPDVILLDIRMPDIPGTEVVRVLRASAELRKTLIVALTASAMVHQQGLVREAGFDEVLVKPCLPDTVCRTVARLIATGRSRSTSH